MSASKNSNEKDITRLEKEIKVLSDRLAKSRNAVDSAVLTDQISMKYDEIIKLRSELPDQKIIPHIDSPTVADRKDDTGIVVVDDDIEE